MNLDSNFSLVSEIEFNFTTEEFHNALNVWINKPHILNKRVSSTTQIVHFNGIQFNSSHIEDIRNAIISNGGDCEEVLTCYAKSFMPGSVNVQVRKLIPRNVSYFDTCVELVISDSDDTSVLFYNLSPHTRNPSVPFPYLIYFDKESCKLNLKIVACECSINANQESGTNVKPCPCNVHQSKTIAWLQSTLLPKLVKWAQHGAQNSDSITSTSSLQLVSGDKYSQLYNMLKQKYGKEITEIWPEVTDPAKFVYEDLAIAAYLMVLWGSLGIRFVDLGCGNGLLVHILNSEGHNGYGIDVRPRKIWGLYPPSTVLKVDTISPSASTVFPDVDWIIGNHSDELTPWIPVITTRSHYKCKMFLLPCCAYQFNGHKYKRRNSRLSIYSDYMAYISRAVCQDLCGLQVRHDRLRIPSTKRIAIVAQARSYGEAEVGVVDARIGEYLRRMEVEGVVETGGEVKMRKEGGEMERVGGEIKINNEGGVKGLEEEEREVENCSDGQSEKKGRIQRDTRDMMEEETKEVKRLQTGHIDKERAVKKLKAEHQEFDRSQVLNFENHFDKGKELQIDSQIKETEPYGVEKANIADSTKEFDKVNVIKSKFDSKELREEFTKNLDDSNESVNSDVTWMKNIKTRVSKEQVRNCTQLNKEVEGSIVQIVVACLLRKQVEVNASWDDDQAYDVPLGDLVREIKAQDVTLLREVARQNGGIKTLIRNHHHMFRVVNNGVTFRKPEPRPHIGEHLRKTKPCWFDQNHPFKCPLSSEECSFIHLR